MTGTGAALPPKAPFTAPIKINAKHPAGKEKGQMHMHPPRMNVFRKDQPLPFTYLSYL